MFDDEIMMKFTLSEQLVRPQGDNDWSWKRVGAIS
jgi:hypothetical protein